MLARYVIGPAGLIVFVLASSSAEVEARSGGPLRAQNIASIDDSRALLDEYCVTCHNQRTLTAGLALDTMDLNDIPASAKVWEKVIRKLGIGMMPPDGARRPDVEDVQAMVSMLETSPDEAAAANPDPGLRLIHRMNRAEYANAIWNGVYTSDQAERGKENFLISCDRCHAQDLSGLTAPALKGDSFMLNWGGGSLNRLFTKIRDTMPPTFGSPLTDEAKLEVVAYILESNGFPSGSDQLVLDTALLDNIQIVGESGELPNFALVQMVGCLAPGPANTWMLTDTSAPTITGEDVASSEALTVAAMKELGDGAFRLVSTNSFEPTAHDGHKMEARGLLYIDESDALLNVTSLQVVASSCGE